MEKYIKYMQRKPFKAMAFFWFSLVMILWGGSKPPTPPPSVEEEGIRITKHEATPAGVEVEWGTEDPRVTDETEFIVEFRKRPIMLGDTVVLTPAELKWQELGRTKDRKLAKDIFLLDSTYELRIRADVTKEMAE